MMLLLRVMEVRDEGREEGEIEMRVLLMERLVRGQKREISGKLEEEKEGEEKKEEKEKKCKTKKEE